jgi:CheY-like chemotaxis protein
MPRMDGFDATRLIRQDEYTNNTTKHTNTRLRIIGLTANAMQGAKVSLCT